MKLNELAANIIFWIMWPFSVWQAWQHGYSLLWVVPVSFVVMSLFALLVSWLLSITTNN